MIPELTSSNPSLISCSPSAISFSASLNSSFKPSLILRFKASIFSFDKITLTCSTTSPFSSTPATPVTPSSSLSISSLTNSVSSTLLLPSKFAALITTGKRFGFIFIINGVVTVSGHSPETALIFSLISGTTTSISAESVNSSIIWETLSELVDEIKLIFSNDAMFCSSGLVIVSSTSSGVAPT